MNVRTRLMRRLARREHGGPCPCCGHVPAVPAATAPVQLDLDRDRLRGLLPGLAWMTGVPQLLGGDHAAIVSWLDSATEKELRALDDVVHLAMLLRLVEWTALTGGAEVLERDGVA